MNYFQQTKFISNSDLTALKRRLNLEEERDLRRAYNFGSLVDAMLTEEAEIERYRAHATEAEQRTAYLVQAAAKADPSLSLFLSLCRKQHEVYRNAFAVEYNGFKLQVPVRVKLDLERKAFRIGGDIKTTACTTPEAFVASIFHFHYDRQAALYMDVTGLDHFQFFGLSKKQNRITRKHEVFKYVIERGSEDYERGRRNYSFLLWNYWFFIYNLRIQ